MDVRDMTFDDNTFDIAIDKGESFGFQRCSGLHIDIRIGTMDAMMTAKGDVWVGSTIPQHHVREPSYLPTGPSATGHRRLHRRSG